MADITMPKMGFDMTEGTIVRWLKQVGDEIKKGEPIAEIETDKVTIEIEAFDSGTLSKIVADEGAVVPVGDVIAVLGGDGAGAAAAPAADSSAQGDQAATAERPQGQPAATQDAGEGGEAVSAPARTTSERSGGGAAATGAATQPSGDAGQAATATTERPAEGYGRDVTAQEEVTGQPAPETQPSGVQGNGARVPASPVAKRIARENNVDISQVSGSGPGGRIVREDVEAFLKGGKQAAAAAPQPAATAQPAQPAAQPAPAAQPSRAVAEAPAEAPAPAGAPTPGTRRETMSRLRQTIARRMAQSKGPVPHFYVTSEIDMSAASELRQQLNATGDVKITVNDLIVKAAALAIKKFPVLNASFAEDALEYHDYIHVSIAVSTENGLLAPAVTDVDKKSLGTISAEAKELIGRTRAGKATLEELQRGTFTVSNLGMYPVDSFVAIINPPQAAIVAVGASTEQPVVRNGQIVIGQIMKATISVDHRVSDGAVAAEYMQELKRLLENPMLILL
jgi:pyruvate dehydrogenase E2 component (dihydrolipoamide acetyltransferase)